MSVVLSATIAAVATPRGTGGVAIVRLSGPDSWAIGQHLTQGQKDWQPSRVVYDWLIDPVDGKRLDEVLILPFKGPHSFTGEDCVEIHCHGGLQLSKVILNHCFHLGAQPATAGEFTRRAFLNGRIDLTQAESILDLIHAQGESLIKLAAHNLHHRAVGRMLTDYLGQISHIQADIVASIDFPDEVDEPERGEVAGRLHQLAASLSQRLETTRRNQVIRDGITVAIIGLPNAGKSSLFNAFLESDRSIVTDIAGTTRDVIQETLSLKGIPMTLVDTAGLRQTEDHVEIIGVERSWQTVSLSQAILYVVDGIQGWTDADTVMFGKIQTERGLIVLNKSDAPGFQQNLPPLPSDWSAISVSATTREGLTDVVYWLEALSDTIPGIGEMEALLSRRQLQHLETVTAEVEAAAQTLQDPALPLDLATVPLTNALLELQGLLGQDTTEMVLDSVFERFCVGK